MQGGREPQKTGTRPQSRYTGAMVKARKRLEFDWAWLRSWFMLTADEKKVLAGIAAIVLVGLAARYLHLRNEQPEPYQPAGLEQDAPRGGS